MICRISTQHHNRNRSLCLGTPNVRFLYPSPLPSVVTGRGPQITNRHLSHPRRSRIFRACTVAVQDMRQTVGIREDYDWCTRSRCKGRSHSTFHAYSDSFDAHIHLTVCVRLHHQKRAMGSVVSHFLQGRYWSYGTRAPRHPRLGPLYR